MNLEKEAKRYVTRMHIWKNSPYMHNTFALCAREMQIYNVRRTHIATSGANLFGLLQGLQI